MGIEYRVPLDIPVSQEWDHVLRAAPYFSQYNQPYRLYEFRSPNRPNLDALMDVQAERCRRLQERPELIRKRTLFHWWPEQPHNPSH